MITDGQPWRRNPARFVLPVVPELRYLPEPYAVLLYLTVSSVLGSTLLLHFAVKIVECNLHRAWLHLPALAVLIAIGMIPFSSADAVEAIVAVCMIVATGLFPIAVIGTILVYIWRTQLRITTLLWLSPIVIATIAKLIPGFDLFGRGNEPVNVL